jgi:hypothetical protein
LRVLNLYRKNKNKKILLLDNIPAELKELENGVYALLIKEKLLINKNN